MIDWNNDGKVDGEDWILTEMMLDDDLEDRKNSGGSGGGCLTSIMLFVSIPVAVLFIGHVIC